MKLSDVEIGGRYEATVSGAITVVRVTGILQEAGAFGRGRSTTRITAVNERTGKQISIRSPQRLRRRVPVS